MTTPEPITDRDPQYQLGYRAGLDAAIASIAAEARRKIDAGECYAPAEHGIIQSALSAAARAVHLRREALDHAVEAIKLDQGIWAHQASPKRRPRRTTKETFAKLPVHSPEKHKT